MNFSTLTPPPHPVPGYRCLGGGVGVGVKTWLAYGGHCASIQILVHGNFFFEMYPLTNGWFQVLSRGFQDRPPYRWGLKLFSGRHGLV